jgi:hypothetical protein
VDVCPSILNTYVCFCHFLLFCDIAYFVIFRMFFFLFLIPTFQATVMSLLPGATGTFHSVVFHPDVMTRHEVCGGRPSVTPQRRQPAKRVIVWKDQKDSGNRWWQWVWEEWVCAFDRQEMGDDTESRTDSGRARWKGGLMTSVGGCIGEEWRNEENKVD